MERKKVAILAIDMLNDYLDPKGKEYCGKCREIIPQIQKLISFARENGIYVVYSNASLLLDTEPMSKKWGLHPLRGSWGAEVIPELKPQKGDITILKRSYDGFYGTELELTLRSLGVETVVAVGIHTHVCVLLTLAGAFNRGFKVVALEDCIATDNKSNNGFGLRFIKTQLGSLMTLKEFINKYK